MAGTASVVEPVGKPVVEPRGVYAAKLVPVVEPGAGPLLVSVPVVEPLVLNKANLFALCLGIIILCEEGRLSLPPVPAPAPVVESLLLLVLKPMGWYAELVSGSSSVRNCAPALGDLPAPGNVSTIDCLMALLADLMLSSNNLMLFWYESWAKFKYSLISLILLVLKLEFKLLTMLKNSSASFNSARARCKDVSVFSNCAGMSLSEFSFSSTKDLDLDLTSL